MMNKDKSYVNYNKRPAIEPKTEEVVEVVGFDPAPVEDTSVPTAYYQITGCTRLNVRENPSVNASVLAILDLSSIFEVRNIEPKGWKHIATKDGIKGYVMADYIKEI